MKRPCSKCGKEKLSSDFYQQKSGRDGYTSHCRSCYKTYRDTNGDAVAKSKACSTYKISGTGYDRLVARASGLCEVCKRPPTRTKRFKRLGIDHNHTTTKVRGLLCTSCNRAIGTMEDSPALLRAAADYLEKYDD